MSSAFESYANQFEHAALQHLEGLTPAAVRRIMCDNGLELVG